MVHKLRVLLVALVTSTCEETQNFHIPDAPLVGCSVCVCLLWWVIFVVLISDMPTLTFFLPQLSTDYR